MTTEETFTYYRSGNMRTSQETTWTTFDVRIDVKCYYCDDVDRKMYLKEFTSLHIDFDDGIVKQIRQHITTRCYDPHSGINEFTEVVEFDHKYRNGLLRRQKKILAYNSYEDIQINKYFSSGRLKQSKTVVIANKIVIHKKKREYEDI